VKERGTITLWMLGLCLMMLLVGGISLDLWRAFSERRALAAAVDAAALAGSSALDEDAFRLDGTVRLVPREAERRARASLAEQFDVGSLRRIRIRVTEVSVRVDVEGSVEFTLLQLARPGEPLEIEIAATARPVVVP
jgi:hypothetical protein